MKPNLMGLHKTLSKLMNFKNLQNNSEKCVYVFYTSPFPSLILILLIFRLPETNVVLGLDQFTHGTYQLRK